nr:hypothetical protein [Tanacetum cinerariifolium]
VNTPRSDEGRLDLIELTVFLLPSDEKVRVEVSDVDLQVSAVRLMLLMLVQKFLLFGLMNWCCSLSAVSLVRNVDSPTKFYMYPRFLQLMIRKQVGDLSTHTTKYTSPVLTQKVFANMRQVGKGFSGVETPLFEGMLVAQEVGEGVADEVHDEGVPAGGVTTEGDVSAAHDEVPTADEEPSIPSPTPPTPPPQPSQEIPSTSQVQPTPPQSPQKLERRNKVKVLKLRRLQKVGTGQRIETSDDTVMDDVSNQGRMIVEMDADADVVLEEAKEVVYDAKVDQDAKVDESVDIQGRQAKSQAKIYKIDLDHANKVLSMQEDESELVEVQEVLDVVTTANLITEVVIVASTTITAAEVLVPAATTTAAASTLTAAPSRRTKGAVIRDHEESTTTTSTIIHTEAISKDKGKGILVEELKPLKKQAQMKQNKQYARELEAELNKNIDWDEVIDHVKKKAKEDPGVKRYQALKRKPQTEAQARKNMMIYIKNVAGFKMDYFKGMSYDDIPKKAAKRQKLDEEVKELKRHLQIVPNEDDDVYTEATPLARKSLVKERFATTKPKNFSDNFLLITLEAMFEKPDIHAQIWKNQRSVHGPAKVKGWKLLESCSVQIITFTTTQVILLVEKKYPLTRFTLDQMLNVVRLKVEEESEVSLELLSFGVDAVMDFKEKHAKCLMLLVKKLVLPSQDDAVD